MFRSFSTAIGIDWVTKETFADKSQDGHGKECVTDFRKLDLDVVLYMLAFQETEPSTGSISESSAARSSSTLLGQSWSGTTTMPCSHHFVSEENHGARWCRARESCCTESTIEDKQQRARPLKQNRCAESSDE